MKMKNSCVMLFCIYVSLNLRYYNKLALLNGRFYIPILSTVHQLFHTSYNHFFDAVCLFMHLCNYYLLLLFLLLLLLFTSLFDITHAHALTTLLKVEMCGWFYSANRTAGFLCINLALLCWVYICVNVCV